MWAIVKNGAYALVYDGRSNYRLYAAKDGRRSLFAECEHAKNVVAELKEGGAIGEFTVVRNGALEEVK